MIYNHLLNSLLIPLDVDYSLTPVQWNGVFEKINTIYAENGSGKTTFTQIIKSLSGKDLDLSLVSRRKTLQTKESFIYCIQQKYLSLLRGLKYANNV